MAEQVCICTVLAALPADAQGSGLQMAEQECRCVCAAVQTADGQETA